MHHHTVRPFGHSISAARALSLLIALGLIWMLYGWTKDPGTWQWLAKPADPQHSVDTPTAPLHKQAAEPIVPGPNELDPQERRQFDLKRELITDRAPLQPREMAQYWRLMAWTRSQSLSSLQKRADHSLTFSQIWERPDDYRGKPLQLRMHLRRVLRYPAPNDNPLGLKQVYEAWGWTDDSKSFPYVIVFPELPPGLKVGAEVRGEVVFAGYFLKIMGYTAYDVQRGAPLLVGRVRLSQPLAAKQPQHTGWTSLALIGLCGIILAGGIGIAAFRRFRRRATAQRPALAPILLPELTRVEEADPISVSY